MFWGFFSVNRAWFEEPLPAPRRQDRVPRAALFFRWGFGVGLSWERGPFQGGLCSAASFPEPKLVMRSERRARLRAGRVSLPLYKGFLSLT